MFRWLWWLAVPILSGCATLRVSSDYDTGADFTALHSYDWVPSPKIKSGNPDIQYDSLMESRVKRFVEEQFALKGYVQDSGQPDFLVTYHVAVEGRVSVSYINELRGYGYGSGWGAGYRYDLRRYGYPGTVVMVTEYQQGTLLLDVVQADKKQLIWRGTATDDAYPELGLYANEKRLREAVQKILAQFPPPID